MLCPLSVLLPCLLAPQSVDPGKNPIELDRTGIAWAASFEAALARADAERRLLLILPDNYAPTEDGSFGFEMFRVASACDERVARLIQRRFVPYYTNLFEHTAAYDTNAFEFVVSEKKQLGKEETSFAGGLPILVMTPSGKLVADFPSAVPADEVLARLLKALEKNGKYNALSRAEKDEEDGLERARLQLALLEYDKARSELKKDTRDEALLLLARIAREEGDWKAHERTLASVTPAHAAEAALEEAWRHFSRGSFEAAAQELATVPEANPGRDEAAYLSGLVSFHAGRKDEAIATWQDLVRSRPLGPWAYRADWASCCAQRGEPSEWKDGLPPRVQPLLGHGEYQGIPNPDLARRDGRN